MSDTSHIYRALTEPLPVDRDGQVIAHPSERAVVHTREQIDLGHKHPELLAALLGSAPEALDDDVKRPIDLGVKHPELIAALLGAPPEPDDDDADDLPPAA